MNPGQMLAVALCAMALMTGAGSSAIAAPSTAAPVSALQVAADTRQTAHASLRLDVRRTKVWVGQAVPVTLQAHFRVAAAVTLEGVPQLTSSGILTFDLAREPRQSTDIVGGEPVLVATWTGTVTPSSAAPLTMTAEMPVRVRYRDAAPRIEQPTQPHADDLFGALDGNPFDTSVIDRFFRQSMGEPLGRLHEETVSLRATAHPIDVQELPTANQPDSFTGAIGKFNLKATISPPHVNVSEPVTLRVVVDGDGDLDRVNLEGVVTSDVWKAYPPKSTMGASAKGTRARKVFEQILVPLRGGGLTVPAVSLTAFDPDSGSYVTRDTQPLGVSVEGTAVVADPPSQSTPAPSFPTVVAQPPPDAGALVAPHVVAPSKVALWLSPLAFLIPLAALASKARRKPAERSLRLTMRQAAARGDVVPFYQAAHTLIETASPGAGALFPRRSARVSSGSGSARWRSTRRDACGGRGAPIRTRAPRQSRPCATVLVDRAVPGRCVVNRRVPGRRQILTGIACALLVAVSLVGGGIAARDLLADETAQARAFVNEGQRALASGDRGAAVLALERARWLAPRSEIVGSALAAAGVKDVEPVLLRMLRLVTRAVSRQAHRRAGQARRVRRDAYATAGGRRRDACQAPGHQGPAQEAVPQPTATRDHRSPRCRRLASVQRVRGQVGYGLSDPDDLGIQAGGVFHH